LEGGPPCFSQDNTCPDLLWILLAVCQFRLRDYHPLWSSFPTHSSIDSQCRLQSTTPVTSDRFALIPFRSPLLWESRLIYIPSGTEMFHFPEFAPRRVLYLSIQWVAPFGNPRIKALWQLPEAYRSLIRPSSPLPAKASTYGS
jgi:hypothetical protein